MSDIIKIKRALVSVYAKEGIVDVAKALAGWGAEIVSTGGTARLLAENGIAVTPVERLTGFAEMLDGRVKTLHPAVHGGILADRSKPEHMTQLQQAGIGPIDLVVVNLYPFEQAVARPDCSLTEAIERIDIGGPCMVRAAAKNHHSVLVWCEPNYDELLAELKSHEGGSSLAFRRKAAARAFARTASYDSLISQYLTADAAAEDDAAWPELLTIPLRKKRTLRYGENPHQQAAVYEELYPGPPRDEANLIGSDPIGGKEISFNNYLDAHAALELVKDLTLHQPDQAAAVFIKHNNPCGAALADEPIEAYRRAYLGDPIAAMGGILAVNRPVGAALAEAVMNSLDRWGRAAGAGAFFLEVWIAPEFAPEALEYIQQAKRWGANVQCIATGPMNVPRCVQERDFRRLTAGMLVQQRDLAGLAEDGWRTVTRQPPNADQLRDLHLAWLVCKHAKSNAIVLARDGQILGTGAGQMSRVTAAKLAIQLAKENGHEDKLAGAVAASDAFFPFRDGPDVLLAAGIRAIIQPGGSKRDAETIAACDEAGAAMVMTGTRHFKH